MFDFFFSLNPIIAITLYSVFILVVINIFYKVLVKQGEAKLLKDRIKELNKKMKEEKGNKEEVSRLMKSVMEENNRLMKMTIKPMMISFIVVILFLPSLAAIYGDQYAALSNNAGNITINNAAYQLEKDGNALKINGEACQMPCMQKIENIKWKISGENEKITFSRISASLPLAIPILNKTEAGWLFWYIIVSIPLMIIIRKLMKIYI